MRSNVRIDRRPKFLPGTETASSRLVLAAGQLHLLTQTWERASGSAYGRSVDGRTNPCREAEDALVRVRLRVDRVPGRCGVARRDPMVDAKHRRRSLQADDRPLTDKQRCG